MTDDADSPPMSDATDAADATAPTEAADPVVVALHADRGEAEVSLAHLASAGIEGQIIDEVEGGTVPVSGAHGVAVAVPARHADRARTVLGDMG